MEADISFSGDLEINDAENNINEPFVDELDEPNVIYMAAWLEQNVETIPSRARVYSSKFVEAGFGTLKRLAKKMFNEAHFLESLGINRDDAEEIADVMNREGFFDALKAAKQALAIEVEESTTVSVCNVDTSMPQIGFAAPIPPPTPSLIHTNSIAAVPEPTDFSVTLVPNLNLPSEPCLQNVPVEINSAPLAIVKKKYRLRTENPEKIRELTQDAVNLLDNLTNALDGQMEAAVIGELIAIATFIDGNGEKQKAMYHATAATVVIRALAEMGMSVGVSERCLQVMALLCRWSDENKSSVSLENCKALGVGGASECIVAVFHKHGLSAPRVIEMGCDAIRCMCALESNCVRFGMSGACKVLGRALTNYATNADLCCWIFRAVGHVALSSEQNREILGTVGACESCIMILQENSHNVNLCTEICWAIRCVAPTENNRARFANEHGPESIAAVLKFHFASDVFVTEACRAFVSLLASDTDDIVPRIVASGVIPLIVKAVKKSPESEALCRWAFNLFHYIACNNVLIPKLISNDVFVLLSSCFEHHAGYEPLAEWGCRCLHKLANFDGSLAKMRQAGLCEMVVSTVQRQAISVSVACYGTLAIGKLASDADNQGRLAEAGACEATVGALMRHDDDPEVVTNASYAIHYLCDTENNVGWMGANGVCEALTAAAKKHKDNDIAVASAVRAVGSLAHRDEGNQVRFNKAGACAMLVTALKTHGGTLVATEKIFRAIYYLCAENSNVKEFGNVGCCPIVTGAMMKHLNDITVLTQGLLAIYGLAVRQKTDTPHKNNTKKLVNKGAIELVLEVMHKYPAVDELQRAAAMAVAALGRLPENQKRLGERGASGLVLSGFLNHPSNSRVFCKLALAMSVLCDNNVVNREKFHAGEAVETLIVAIHKHEKSVDVVAECLRALVIMTEHAVTMTKLRNLSLFQQIVRVVKIHDTDAKVARWGANIIYSLAVDDTTRARLGQAKACEAITDLMYKHGNANASVTEWGCKAIVALGLIDLNKLRFGNAETCIALGRALKEHSTNSTVAEWGSAAVISIVSMDGIKTKLGSVGVCKWFKEVLVSQASNETAVRLACEAIYELAIEPTNQIIFGQEGTCEVLTDCVQLHIDSALGALQVCKAVAAISRQCPPNADKFSSTDICEFISRAQKLHLFNVSMAEWTCRVVAALSDKNPANQGAFGESGTCEHLAAVLNNHRPNEVVVACATRAIRSVILNHFENKNRMITLQVLSLTVAALRTHGGSAVVVEHSGWIIANAVPDADDSAAVAVYNDVSTWDILASSISIHVEIGQTVKWGCAAVAVVASRSAKAHVPLCDSLMGVLIRHADKPPVCQTILIAMGEVARSNIDNSNRLGKNRACEATDKIMSKYVEGDDTELYCAILQCIAGLAHNNVSNQDAFNSYPSLCKHVVEVLYNEMNTADVAKFGCICIAELALNHHNNQFKLGHAANFFVDVLHAHSSSAEVTMHACVAISALSHGNISNRNRFGANEACQAISYTLMNYLDQFNDVTLNAVKAIANLAANNPNNQAKLGTAGACEALVGVLRKACTGSTPSPAMVKWVCWAIGNMVQLGKGPTMIIDESSKQNSTLQVLRPVKSARNTTRFNEAGVGELLVLVLKRFSADVVVLQWCCRALNNMSKSHSSCKRLKEAGVMTAVSATVAAFKDTSSGVVVLEWASMALESLNQHSDDLPVEGQDNSPMMKKSASQGLLSL